LTKSPTIEEQIGSAKIGTFSHAFTYTYIHNRLVIWIANLYLRLSLSFACDPVEPAGKRKKEIIFAHTI
jgi:hypothetical protein